MFGVVITEKGGAQKKMDFDKSEVTIGRVQGNDIILPKGNVSKRHSRIVLKDDRFIVVDLKSTNGTYVNGRKITSPLVVKPGDKIYIGDFILTLDEGGGPGASIDEEVPASRPPQLPKGQRSNPPPSRDAIAAPPPLPSAGAAPQMPASPRRPTVVDDHLPAMSVPPPPTSQDARGPVRSSTGIHVPPAPSFRPPPPSRAADSQSGLSLLMYRLSEVFDTDNVDPAASFDEDRLQQAQAAIEQVLSQLQSEGLLSGGLDRDEVSRAAYREAVGLGALEPLLSDEAVREVIVESPRRILADLGDGLEAVEGTFSSAVSLLTIAKRLVARAGETLHPSIPIHEAALPDGTHVMVLQAPIASPGPVLSIRPAGKPKVSMDHLVDSSVLSADMRDLLQEAVRLKKNIIVSGAIGSGVTTLLGALAALSEDTELLAAVQEVPDLAIPHEHVVSLTASDAIRGITQRQLLKQATRFRADRLVVDDLQASSVTDVLAAMMSRGALLVGMHAASAALVLRQLEVFASLDAPIGDNARTLVAGAVHLIVHIEQLPSELRRVTAIIEVLGNEKGEFKTQELFAFRDKRFVSSGAPNFTR